MKTITLTDQMCKTLRRFSYRFTEQEWDNISAQLDAPDADPNDAARVRLMEWVHAKEGRMIVCLDVNLQALEDYNDEIACELNPTALWLAIQEREGREGKK